MYYMLINAMTLGRYDNMLIKQGVVITSLENRTLSSPTNIWAEFVQGTPLDKAISLLSLKVTDRLQLDLLSSNKLMKILWL